MSKLSETWFAEGYIDFELKKYTLLAYLQKVGRCFGENKLYPELADIIFHYNNLLQFKNNKTFLQQQFPRRLNSIDMQRLTALYEGMIADDDLMKELEEIMHYALGQIKTTIEDGTSIYEFVEEKMEICPVGLVPLDTQEGYFMLRDGGCKQTRVYHYRLSFFEKQDNKYRSIITAYIDSWQRNFINTDEQIKVELIRHRKDVPNPAVYSISTTLSFPLEETLLPIARRSLVHYITTAA